MHHRLERERERESFCTTWLYYRMKLHVKYARAAMHPLCSVMRMLMLMPRRLFSAHFPLIAKLTCAHLCTSAASSAHRALDDSDQPSSCLNGCGVFHCLIGDARLMQAQLPSCSSSAPADSITKYKHHFQRYNLFASFLLVIRLHSWPSCESNE